MTQTEIERLQELRQKEQLTEKEFAQWEFLEKKVINDEHIEQFRKNQQEKNFCDRCGQRIDWEGVNSDE